MATSLQRLHLKREFEEVLLYGFSDARASKFSINYKFI